MKKAVNPPEPVLIFITDCGIKDNNFRRDVTNLNSEIIYLILHREIPDAAFYLHCR